MFLKIVSSIRMKETILSGFRDGSLPNVAELDGTDMTATSVDLGHGCRSPLETCNASGCKGVLL